MGQTYVVAQLATDETYQVRFLVGDNVTGKMLLQDEEIDWLLSTEANVYMAAAAASGTLASLLSAAAGATVSGAITRKRVGNTDISYSASGRTSQDYLALAKALRARGSGHQTPFAGGISVADKETRQEDTDRPSDGFRRAQFDYDVPLHPETGDLID